MLAGAFVVGNKFLFRSYVESATVRSNRPEPVHLDLGRNSDKAPALQLAAKLLWARLATDASVSSNWGCTMAGPKYYPILKWKAGEQKAVQQLDPADRAPMLPILELQNVTGGLTPARVVTSLDKAKIGTWPVGLDLRPVQAPVTFATLAKYCAAAAKAGHVVYPVVQALDLFAQLTNVAALSGVSGVVLRMRLQVITLAGALAAIAEVRRAIGKNVPLHVVYDVGPIGEVDTGALVGFAEPFVRDTLAQGHATNVALAGGSFPLSLAGFPVGNNLLPRREWQVWQQLRARPGSAEVRFGDFNVTNPEPLAEDIDPRAMNPAAAIRYALDGEWWLLRGRGAKTSGFDQYNTLCRVLVADARYAGQPFSYGDDRYHHYAQPGASTGNFMTWRRDAASHHLVQTVRQLGTLI